MEKWEIANRTRGAVEIGCVRTTALQPGERYVFSGPVPEPLRWLEGDRKIFLTRQGTPEVKPVLAARPATVAVQRTETEDAPPNRGSKSSRQELKPQAS